MKVLITDSLDAVSHDLLAKHGLETEVHLNLNPDDLKALAPGFEGWLIRSGTTLSADLIEAADALRVIGRAGVGVDNVDLEAATRKGVLVLNAPDGNTISTAEHTCAMMLALARQIPRAHASLEDGGWERKKFTGAELYGKVLGVIGVGKVGRGVIKRMQAFGMRVLAFDPVLSSEAAGKLGIGLVTLERLFAESDFITVHTPLNDKTRDLLNAETLARCKEGVRIINCARGGVVNEQDLLDALEAGHVGGAALDVFSAEPPSEQVLRLIRHPRVVATPHIAASTGEAQEKVARQVTEQLIDALQGRPVTTPVNAAAIRMATQTEVQPYLVLADKLGAVAGQMLTGNLTHVTVSCRGEAAKRYAEVLTIAVLRGVLSEWVDEPVNFVNAMAIASDMGVHIEEQRDDHSGSFVNVVSVTLRSTEGERTVAGTLFGTDEPRIVEVDGYEMELRPEGSLLFYRNVDRPGMLATVGSLLADAGLNIAALALGRREAGSLAMTALSLDEKLSESVVRRVAALEGVQDVVAVHA